MDREFNFTPFSSSRFFSLRLVSAIIEVIIAFFIDTSVLLKVLNLSLLFKLVKIILIQLVKSSSFYLIPVIANNGLEKLNYDYQIIFTNLNFIYISTHISIGWGVPPKEPCSRHSFKVRVYFKTLLPKVLTRFE